MFTLIVFLAVISVLVVVHEFGHFWVAKKSGMKVEEFGFGFPPRLWNHKRGDTVYSINLIPFGGFVRIFGEEGEHRREPGSFGHGTFLQKAGVVIAGVVMNFLFAVLLLMIVNFLGLRVGIFDQETMDRATDQKIEVLQVLPSSPAEQAGLRTLDQLVGFTAAGQPFQSVATPDQVQQFAYTHAGQDVIVTVRRGSEDVRIPMHLRPTSPTGEGPMGISLALTGVVRYSWYESIWRGIASAGALFAATLMGYVQILTSLFRSGHLGADISGPIGIATLTGQAARVGVDYLIQFVAMISVNLAVLNILPFPALDGGRLVLVITEKLRGRPLSHHIEDSINAVGFFILIALMVAVTIKDIVHFF